MKLAFLACIATAAAQPASWLPRISAANLLYAPDDSKVPQTSLPIISNGQVATQFMSSSIYVSLLFNGYLTQDPSHRAAIPTTFALSIQGAVTVDTGLDLLNATFYRRSYLDPTTGPCNLDSLNTCSNAAGRLYIEQRFYAHRVLPTVLVHEVELLTQDAARRDYGADAPVAGSNGSPGDPLVMLYFNNASPSSSSDITFSAVSVPYGNPYWIINGTTNVAETKTSGLQGVCVLWSHYGSENATNIGTTLALYGYGQTHAHLTVIRTTVETPYPQNLIGSAIDDFNVAMDFFNNGTLHSSHIQEWQEMVWASGIEVGGRPEVALVTNSSLYAILSSLRPDRAGGLCPSGLTNGYNGHSFWDTETWMLPSVRLLFPDLAASLLQYRYDRMDGARQKALSYSPPFNGTMWPWESALTGVETCPVWAATGLREQHINGDIPQAIYDYWRSIDDDGNGWLSTIGYPMLEGTATFWMSKLVNDNPNGFNGNGGPLSITDVIPPDEYADHTNNSAWTNVGAILALRYAASAAQQLGKPASVWSAWLDAADRIVVLYNKTSPSGAAGGFHPEYQAYNASAAVKQADVVLIPLVKSLLELQQQLASQNASFTPSSIANDLAWYAQVTDPDGPAMTWGAFAGVSVLLGDYQAAVSYYNRSFATVSGPYRVWFEVVGGQGTPGFLTGAGGFLQTPSYFSGLHINDTSLSISAGPVLPEGVTYMRLRGVSYLGNRLDITWDDKEVTIAMQAPSNALTTTSEEKKEQVRSQRGRVVLRDGYQVKAQPLVVVDVNGKAYPLSAGGEVTLPVVGPPADVEQRVVITRL